MSSCGVTSSSSVVTSGASGTANVGGTKTAAVGKGIDRLVVGSGITRRVEADVLAVITVGVNTGIGLVQHILLVRAICAAGGPLVVSRRVSALGVGRGTGGVTCGVTCGVASGVASGSQALSAASSTSSVGVRVRSRLVLSVLVAGNGVLDFVDETRHDEGD